MKGQDQVILWQTEVFVLKYASFTNKMIKASIFSLKDWQKINDNSSK